MKLRWLHSPSPLCFSSLLHWKTRRRSTEGEECTTWRQRREETRGWRGENEGGNERVKSHAYIRAWIKGERKKYRQGVHSESVKSFFTSQIWILSRRWTRVLFAGYLSTHTWVLAPQPTLRRLGKAWATPCPDLTVSREAARSGQGATVGPVLDWLRLCFHTVGVDGCT